MIMPFQSAFITGGLIQNCTIIEHEAYHHLRVKNNSAREECVIKLDILKAYDRV